jgi:hypothetical protein
MQLFPSIVETETRADAVADKFRSFCAGTGRSPVVCEATAAAVAGSVAGNLGRRAAALCASLKVSTCGDYKTKLYARDCTMGGFFL